MGGAGKPTEVRTSFRVLSRCLQSRIWDDCVPQRDFWWSAHRLSRHFDRRPPLVSCFPTPGVCWREAAAFPSPRRLEGSIRWGEREQPGRGVKPPAVDRLGRRPVQVRQGVFFRPFATFQGEGGERCPSLCQRGQHRVRQSPVPACHPFAGRSSSSRRSQHQPICQRLAVVPDFNSGVRLGLRRGSQRVQDFCSLSACSLVPAG